MALYSLGVLLIRSLLLPISYQAMFYIGYGMALFHQVVLNRFVSLTYAIIFDLGTFIIRMLLLSPLQGEITPKVFGFHLVLDILILLGIHLKEKNMRGVYQQLYCAKEEAKKFESLIANHLPSSIFVLAAGSQKLLFSNLALQKELDLQENTKIQEKLKDFMIDTTRSLQEGHFHKDVEFLISTVEVCTLDDVFKLAQNQAKIKQALTVFASYVDKNGVQKKFEAKIFPIKWDIEEAIAFVLNNITLQETILALKIADANKDKVIACVSHELRTPVNGTLGILQMMQNQTDDPVILKHINLCKSINNLQLSIINSMLDLQLLRQNKLKPLITTFDLRQLLEEIKSLFEFHCQQKGLDFVIDIQKDLSNVYVSSDRTRLQQIIINLVTNAVKFTFKGGITLRVKTDVIEPNHIMFSVEDTGVGIKDEDIKKLFKMFGKLEDSEGINTQGIGLGLTISSGLVHLLSNKKESGISVNSEYGKGTQFFFSIPRNFPEASSGESQENMIPTERVKKENLPKKILKYSKDSFANLQSTHHMAQSTHINLYKGPSIKSNDGSLDELAGDVSSLDFTGTNKFSFTPSPNVSPRRRFLEKSEMTSLQSFISKKKEKASVLLVDDNPFNIMIASHVLVNQGLEVVTALNGQQAIDVVKKHAGNGKYFKFSLMDLQMPILDGFQTSRILNDMISREEILDLPIIALSANDREEDKKRCFECGMCEHISKPLTDSQIREIVKKYS